MSKLFAIGDIHGHKKTLEALIRTLGVKPGDTIVFLGDYLDRGPDPRGVIDYILALQKCEVNTICLMGNHEAMWLDMLRKKHHMKIMDDRDEGISHLRAGDYFHHPSNGGCTTMNQYTNLVCDFEEETDDGTVIVHEEVEIPEEHLRFFRNMKPYHVLHGEKGDVLFLHAGLSRRSLRRRSLENAIRCSMEEAVLKRKSPFLFERETLDVEPRFRGLLVHGHTPVPSVFKRYWSLFQKTHDSLIEEFCYEMLASYHKPHVVRGKLNLDSGITHREVRKMAGVEFVQGVPQEVVLQENLDAC